MLGEYICGVLLSIDNFRTVQKTYLENGDPIEYDNVPTFGIHFSAADYLGHISQKQDFRLGEVQYPVQFVISCFDLSVCQVGFTRSLKGKNWQKTFYATPLFVHSLCEKVIYCCPARIVLSYGGSVPYHLREAHLWDMKKVFLKHLTYCNPEHSFVHCPNCVQSFESTQHYMTPHGEQPTNALGKWVQRIKKYEERFPGKQHSPQLKNCIIYTTNQAMI